MSWLRHRGRVVRAVALAVVWPLAAGLGAGQADAAITAKVKKACKGDYLKLCPRYKVGSPQLRACMEAKQSEISWGCIGALIDAGEVGRSARR